MSRVMQENDETIYREFTEVLKPNHICPITTRGRITLNQSELEESAGKLAQAMSRLVWGLIAFDWLNDYTKLMLLITHISQQL